MIQKPRAIFRSKAWESYVQRQERTVLPRFFHPTGFIFFWLLFALLMVLGSVAGWEEIPIYVAGSGVLLQQQNSPLSREHETMALIFLPASRPLGLRNGASVQLQIDRTGPVGSGQIEQIEPGLISPQQAWARYALGSARALLITAPSRVLIVRVRPPLSDPIFAGSLVSAQVPIGTQRLLTLLLGSDN